MKLMRFLAAGRTLVGIKTDSGRYKVSGKHLLPAFGAGRRNPFGSRPEPTAKPVAASAIAQPATPTPVVPESVSSSEPSWLSVTIGSGVEATRRAFSKILSFPRKAKSPPVPRFPKAPVQCELSLDRVRVVRNDLSDADLEVVPAQRQKAPSLQPSVTGTDQAGAKTSQARPAAATEDHVKQGHLDEGRGEPATLVPSAEPLN